MAISYNKLWKLLIDRNMTKTELRKKAGLTTNVIAKVGKNSEIPLNQQQTYLKLGGFCLKSIVS